MGHFRRWTPLFVALVSAAALVGCGDDDKIIDQGPSSAPPTTVTTSAEASPTDATPKTGEGSSTAGVTVTAIRIGHHDGYDRVVYEFGGKGTPGWKVAYVDKAIQDGSGKTLDVSGRSILEVTITGAAYPFDSGVSEYLGPNPLEEPTASAVAEVRYGATYEGIAQSFIGVTADKPPFAVSALTNPTRLVVDVAN